MAEYKNQHIVPKVYLEYFSNKKIFNDNEVNNIYVSEKKSIYESIEKNIKKSFFTKPHFYNFDEQKKEPIIEKNLSKIENDYKKNLKSLINHNISLSDILYISNFTLLQLQRVDSHIDNFQNSFNKIADIYDGFATDTNMKEEVENIALKMLLDYKIDNMYKSNIVYEQGIHFIVNNTDIPFITSDKPVVHNINHIDQIKSIFNDTNIKYDDNYLPSDKSVFFFLPLNKNFALIATKFLICQNNLIQYITIDNKGDAIIRLNLMSYQNANKYIYSSLENPFKGFEEIIKSINHQYQDIGYWCQIYTDKNRYILEIKKYEHGLNNILLYLKNDKNIKSIMKDRKLKEISIYHNENEVSHMKEIKLNEFDNKFNILKISSKVQLGTDF